MAQIIDMRNDEVLWTSKEPSLRNISFEEVKLEYANFANCDLVGSSFMGCRLKGANFFYASLTDCNFANADLREVSFAYANVQRANFYGARFGDSDDIRPANFSGANFEKSRGLIVGPYRSDGYQFFLIQCKGVWHIIAGCRNFGSFKEARKHWKKTRGGTSLGVETMDILAFLEKRLKRLT